LGTDWIIAPELARRISERTGSILLPVMLDIYRSIAKWGIKQILFPNGHREKIAALRSICLKPREDFGALSAVAQLFDIFDEVDGWKATEHEGMIETC